MFIIIYLSICFYIFRVSFGASHIYFRVMIVNQPQGAKPLWLVALSLIKGVDTLDDNCSNLGRLDRDCSGLDPDWACSGLGQLDRACSGLSQLDQVWSSLCFFLLFSSSCSSVLLQEHEFTCLSSRSCILKSINIRFNPNHFHTVPKCCSLMKAWGFMICADSYWMKTEWNDVFNLDCCLCRDLLCGPSGSGSATAVVIAPWS